MCVMSSVPQRSSFSSGKHECEAEVRLGAQKVENAKPVSLLKRKRTF